jgi:hypothetical protein
VDINFFWSRNDINVANLYTAIKIDGIVNISTWQPMLK